MYPTRLHEYLYVYNLFIIDMCVCVCVVFLHSVNITTYISLFYLYQVWIHAHLILRYRTSYTTSYRTFIFHTHFTVYLSGFNRYSSFILFYLFLLSVYRNVIICYTEKQFI